MSCENALATREPVQRYAITDRTLLPPHPGGISAALVDQVARWATSGIHFIQLREKDLPQPVLQILTRQLAASIQTHSTHTRLLVSGLTPEQAIACGADGVHLPGPVDPSAIRRAHQHQAIVSVSCHTLHGVSLAAQALAAEALDAQALDAQGLDAQGLDAQGLDAQGHADLILWAPVFGKQLPSGATLPGTGLDALAQACRAASAVPVFALGGVTRANAPSCIRSGATGIAGIRLFH